MTHSTRTIGSSPGRRAKTAAPGCLVLVVDAQQSALDLLLTATRRRMPSGSFEFPMRITTRRNGWRDGEIAVTRNAFREIERDGGFAATWQAGGHRFGLPSCLRSLLVEGRTAVVAAPAGAIAELQAICPDLRVVRLTDQLEAARGPLTPRACLRRMLGPRLAAGLETRRPAPRTEAVCFTGHWPSAVRALSETLLRIEEERERGSRRQRAARSGARAARGTLATRLS
ncbi:MAG: hypothetical protein KJZ80_08510 [Hyphomicrobiaceae bacterium]|nr:hypothetical protein [Hyphomicrobiaceae bacterium]